ncbi:MAG: cytochrome C oxidase subunit IV family protein [Gemmataceae bacterium]
MVNEQEHRAADVHVLPVATYLLVFGGLVLLTILTVAMSFVEMGSAHIVVALTIAGAKAILVLLYFMHVLYSGRLTWLAIAASLYFFLILIGLTLADFATRDWLGYPLR